MLVFRHRGLLSAILFLLCGLAHADRSSSKVVVILDASGSMHLSGQVFRTLASASTSEKHQMQPKYKTRMDVAKELAKSTVAEYDRKSYDIALVVFSHRAASCDDIHIEMDFGSQSPVSKAGEIIAPIHPFGATPIAASLKKAGEHLATTTAKTKEIIIITDGMESCWGDPTGVARALNGKYGIKTSIIGLDIPSGAMPALRAIAEAGGGVYRGEEGIGAPNGITPSPAEPGGATKVSFDGRDPNNRKLESKPMSDPAPPTFIGDPGPGTFDSKMLLK